MADRNWKLGDDLSVHDNLLDPVTFDDLILAVHCNCPQITICTVLKQMEEIMCQRITDTMELLGNNLEEICKEAMKGRGGYEEDC